jgi:RHS repeat-associated protein
VPLARIDHAAPAANDANADAARDAVYYFHNDVSGMPEELTDADGDLVWQARYKVWGNAVQEEWIQREAPRPQNLRFQGQYLDRETGLHYNTFRFYDPDVGRFINQDPIGLNGGLNLYAYAPNPVDWIDPWGLSCTELDKLRRSGVAKAWRQERRLVKLTGQGTRTWTRAEKAELLSKGRVTGYEGHHINSVEAHPQLAGTADNIKFVKGRAEHILEHGGNFQNSTSGAMLDRSDRLQEAITAMQN